MSNLIQKNNTIILLDGKKIVWTKNGASDPNFVKTLYHSFLKSQAKRKRNDTPMDKRCVISRKKRTDNKLSKNIKEGRKQIAGECDYTINFMDGHCKGEQTFTK